MITDQTQSKRDIDHVSRHHLPMAGSPRGSPRLTASKDLGALQNESPLTSVSKEASPISVDTQSKVDARNREADVVPQLLNDQKSSLTPSTVTEDVASQQEDIYEIEPPTELQPATGSTVLTLSNAPTIVTDTAEFIGIEIDSDVRTITSQVTKSFSNC